MKLRPLSLLLAVSGTATALVVAACVGDDPGVSSVEPPDSGTEPNDSGSGDPDTSTTDAADTGTNVDSGNPVSVFCHAAPPQVFPSIPNTGPFCQGAPGNHCASGQHCCRDQAANTQVCAASCPGNTIDIACFNSAECSGATKMLCCGSGTPKNGVCTYNVLEDFTKTRCATSCANTEFQLCEGSIDCDGGTCTPMRALDPPKKSTTAVIAAACL